jgi:membrane protein DedA with SNARE-associated domain
VIGTFLEGETILVLGGLVAHLQYLSLPGVIACGFIGTLFGDQLCFFLGRRHGRRMLAYRAGWQEKADRVLRTVERHQNLVMVGFRFFYGFRIVTPIAIGISTIPFWRFLMFNAIGAALWATVIASAGFFFGRAVEALLGDLKRYEIELISAVVAAGAMIWLLRFLRRRHAARESGAGRHPAGPGPGDSAS